MNSQGCIFLEEGIHFDVDSITDCCILHNDGRGAPLILKNYQGEVIDWEKLFQIKQERIEHQKIVTIYECKDCYRLCEYQFKNIKKISEFHFTHCRVCNSKCIYCSGIYNMGTRNYNAYPVIKDLIEKGYYKSGGEATMQGGEPTLMKNFEELVDLFVENGTFIRIHTNAIKFSEKVCLALKQDKGTVVSSLDCGCYETYKKIKRVDFYQAAVENIKKYVDASCDNVIVKYIIIPGVNDNIVEIDKFFDLMRELKVKNIAVDIEVQYARKYENKDISPHIYLLYDYFEYKAKKFSIELITYSFMVYVLRNRKIKKSKFIANKFLFNWVLNIYNQKNKNINYR